jgi:hypothetical protein
MVRMQIPWSSRRGKHLMLKFLLAYTPDKLDIRFQKSGFMTRDLFLDWLITILFPEIERR